MQSPVGIEVPSHAPDHSYFRRSCQLGVAQIEGALWYTTETGDSVLHVRRWTGYDDRYSSSAEIAVDRVRNTLEYRKLGLGPVIDALGIEAECLPNEAYTNYTLRMPANEVLVERINQLQYPKEFGRRMRARLFRGDFYDAQDLFSAIHRRQLILSNDRVAYHDAVDHMLASLSLSSEILAAIAHEATRLEFFPEGHPRFAVRRQAGLKKDFLGMYDARVSNRNFLRFLREEPEELQQWAYFLETDVEAVRGYAQRAKEQLQHLSLLPPSEGRTNTAASAIQRIRRAAGHLQLGQLAGSRR